jgi:ribosomal-protein-alanine N-acetyltransferase
MLTLDFKPFPRITTDRLVLRKIDPEDVPQIFFQRSDPRMLEYVDREPARTVEEALDWIRLITDKEDGNESIAWAICLRDNPQLIGTACFWNIRKEHYRAEIGYGLHPDYRGRGLMGETVAAIIRYGFEVMKLHSIEANVNPQNTASIAVLERAGFVREGYFKEDYYCNGQFLDSAIYSLLTHLTRG